METDGCPLHWAIVESLIGVFAYAAVNLRALTLPTCRTNQEDSTGGVTDERWNLIVYSVLIVVQFLGLVIRSATFFSMCIIASVNLFNNIFFCLLRAPISFFDNNPAGMPTSRFAVWRQG